MKRLFGWVVLALVATAGVASAQGASGGNTGGLGFHNAIAPLGIRWWMSDKWAIDAAIGVGSTENTAVDENMSNWALDLGIPICLKKFDKVHFSVRPGLLYTSQEVVVPPPGPPVNTDNNTTMSIGAELEAEVFLAENFSVSAAQGFAVTNNDPAVGSSSSNWGTTGRDFTSVGFHVYLFGKK
jgi:hypothetical protein